MNTLPDAVTQLLLKVAQESFVESEYAGVTREFCAHCGHELVFLSKPDAQRFTHAHDESCATREARIVLGDTFTQWDDAQLEAERLERERTDKLAQKAANKAKRHREKQLQLAEEQRAKSAALRELKKAMKGGYKTFPVPPKSGVKTPHAPQ